MRGLIACLLASCALGACASGAGVQSEEAAPRVVVLGPGETMPGALEPIHAAAFTADQAVFRVSSNGCTGKGDITPVLTRGDNEVLITLRRTTEDRCDAVQADGVELMWSFEELGLTPGQPIEINNPYQLTPGG